MRILVTGGLGFIGSHFIVKALQEGHEVITIDNLSNASLSVKERIETITGKTFTFIEADLRDKAALDGVFKAHDIDSVVHFAGLKSVAESTEHPLRYVENNVTGSANLLEAMQNHGVKNFLFSSSATVYGTGSGAKQYTEETPKAPINPYGKSKLMVEQVLEDVCGSDKDFSAIALRYFNPIGAHESGLIGEDPQGRPNNLMPYINRVASGIYKELSVYGTDYNTPDGTGVRDYIHVMDLAEGHLAAMEHQAKEKGFNAFNLGGGRGHSVREVVSAFEKVNGVAVPCKDAPRRAGDLAAYWADPSKAEKVLGWKVKRGLDVMVKDAWRWQQYATSVFEWSAKNNGGPAAISTFDAILGGTYSRFKALLPAMQATITKPRGLLSFIFGYDAEASIAKADSANTLVTVQLKKPHLWQRIFGASSTIRIAPATSAVENPEALSFAKNLARKFDDQASRATPTLISTMTNTSGYKDYDRYDSGHGESLKQDVAKRSAAWRKSESRDGSNARFHQPAPKDKTVQDVRDSAARLTA